MNINRKKKLALFKILRLFFSAILAFALFSCSDVITLELDKTDPVIVIEGVITDQGGAPYVALTKSTNFYRPNEFEKISNAEVILKDDAGNSAIMSEVMAGLYTTSAIQGIPGRTYYLTVRAEGKEYTAESTMPQPMELDSVTYGLEEHGFGHYDYEVTCWFQDRPNVKDYARLKVYEKGIQNEMFYLYDDRLTDGEQINYTLWGLEVGYGAEYKIEFITFEKEMYEYFSMLSIVSIYNDNQQGFSLMQPGNPISNISGGALGYFGAMSVRTYNVKIE